MIRHLLWALLFLAPAAEAATSCRDSPLLQGACFEIRGRLELANGNPGWRIFQPDSRRVLGVMDALRSSASRESGGLPPGVMRAAMQSRLPNNAVRARFKVCPLTRDIPGHMRIVCIAGMQ